MPLRKSRPERGPNPREQGRAIAQAIDSAAPQWQVWVVAREYQTFAEFWPFYLREHSKPRTRSLHYAGTTLVVAIALFALVTGRWLWLLAIPFAGYGFAWVAHFRVEMNRPATFTYPLWSLAADFRMWWLWLTGRLAGELEKAGVRQ